MDSASPCLFETKNFIGDTGGIEKCVEMVAVDLDSVITAGNDSPAAAAKQGFLAPGYSVVRSIGIRHINCPEFILFPAVQMV